MVIPDAAAAAALPRARKALATDCERKSLTRRSEKPAAKATTTRPSLPVTDWPLIMKLTRPRLSSASNTAAEIAPIMTRRMASMSLSRLCRSVWIVRPRIASAIENQAPIEPIAAAAQNGSVCGS